MSDVEQEIAAALRARIDPHRTPEFMERLQRRIKEDAAVLAAIEANATCWLDAERNLWFAHACKNGWEETRLPGTIWRASRTPVQLSVSPSVHCMACGFHKTLVDGAWT